MKIFNLQTKFTVALLKALRHQLQMNMQIGKKFSGITENLNRILSKSLQNFSQNTEWTDINNWLLTLESVLKDYPSPFITQKTLLSKRLNQCMNPILPEKIHEVVLRIHEIMFSNMKNASEGNPNTYIKLFCSELAVYSVSILPYFKHTSVKEHRMIILRLIRGYYLDLGKELIPMLPGLMKSLLPVCSETLDEHTVEEVLRVIDQLVSKAGRRYVLGVIWSMVLKFDDCKEAGMKYLGRSITKMDFIQGEEEFEESHGFSEEEAEIRMEEMLELQREQQGKDGPVTGEKQRQKSADSRKNFTNELQTPINDLKVHQKPSLEPQKINEFNVSGDKLANSEGESLSADRLQEMDELLDDKFLKGIKEVSENENDSNVDEKSPKLQELSGRKIKRLDTRKLFESSHHMNAPQSPNYSEDNFLQNAKAFKSTVGFDDNGSASISSSMNLNKVPLVTTAGIEEIKEGVDSDRQENNYPNSNTLVISALISCLEQDLQIIKRAALDFMFSHLRIKSEVFDQSDRKLLVEAVVSLYKRKEISICKRANRWLFGKQDEENRYQITDKNEFVIEYVINAFKKILEKEPTNIDNCAIPIKILQNFYIEHPHLVDMTLGKISLNVIRYIFNFGTKSKNSSPNFDGDDSELIPDEILKSGKRFLQNLPSYYSIILKSLGQDFLRGVKANDSYLCFEAVKYMDFCYVHLMRHEHGQDQLMYITLTLESLCQGLENFTQKGERAFSHKNNKESMDLFFLKDTLLLTFNLIARRSSVQRYNKKAIEKINEKYYEETGVYELPPERVEYQNRMKQEEKQQEVLYVGIMKNLEKFFVGLGQHIKTIPNIYEFQEPFRLCSLAVVQIQGHLPKEPLEQHELPPWFLTIEQGIRLSNPVVSLASIEAMIKILMWDSSHLIYSSLRQILVEEKSKKVGNDYQKLALEKLWALLDFPHMHSKVIDMIVAFSKFFPYEFTETVKRSFTKINSAEKQASIQRFSHFWRLTGFKYKELLSTNRQFGELNKVGLFMMLDFLDDPNPLVRHASKNWLMESIPLFNRIIEPLLHELLRNCSDWYETPKGMLLIKNVYDTNHVFNTIRRIRSILSTGSYVVLRHIYQTQISESLDELRAKVTPINKPFLSAPENDSSAIDEVVLEQSILERQPVLPKALEKHFLKNEQQKQEKSAGSTQRLAYFDLLMILVIKYIEGHTIESMGIEFHIGNSGVNASAVEFLETLIDYIDNPRLCQRIIEFVMGPLTKVLRQVIMNREYIMQIQIVGILKKIFFSSSFRKKAEAPEIRKFFKNVFTENNNKFLAGILQGLHTPFSYVRSQFINFLTICIPLIADFLEPQECTESVQHIIFTYYKIIKQLRRNLLAEVLENEHMQATQSSAISKEVLNEIQSAQNRDKELVALHCRIVELAKNIKKESHYVNITPNNLTQLNITNETLSILHGLSAILNYFFDLDKIDPKSLTFEFTNPYTFFDTFKSIISLGLLSSEKDGQLIQRKQFLHNTQTCEAMLDDLTPVYETVLRAWPLSEQYVRISTEEFSSIGITLFNFEKFTPYNKIVHDLIEYVQEEKESIWGKIFSIMQPLFYRFPKEIMDIYLKIWVRECHDYEEKARENSGEAGDAFQKENSLHIHPNSEKTELLMKIVETIIVNDFPMNVIIHAILESDVLKEITDFYSHSTSNKKGNVLNFQNNKQESKLLFFVYVYLSYVHLEVSEMTKDKLLELWSLIMKVLKPFEKSKSPLVSIWILEILNLAARKYSPKELLYNESFKHDLHRLINDKLKFVAMVASKKEHFFFRDPMTKINFNSAEEDEASVTVQYGLVLPFPPTIYEIYLNPANDTDKELIRPVRAGDNVELEAKYRLYCFKILKKLGLEILQNTYLPEKMHWVIVRAGEWLDIVLQVIEDKNPHNMLNAECASEILYDILDRARILFIKSLKPKVLAIFNKDDFFICNANTLNYWSKIVDWIVSMDKYNETFSEYLGKVSLSSSYFGSQTEENKKRIKSFERICFILYSGSKDKYSQKIKGLLQKIADVIKISDNAHPALLILILFAIRILILRLSEISLNQLFIDIWPMILALLMQIFSKQYVKVNLENEVSKNPNLLLASLKLIEMISLVNLSDFAHHQWIFIYDYFGVRLNLELTDELKKFISQRPELSDVIETSSKKKQSPFIFKPSLISHLPSETSINYKNEKNGEMTYKPLKRQIVIKDSFVHDESELKVQVLFLMQYLNTVNEYRTKVENEELERVIVDDFIQLDSFIHNIK